MFDLQSKAKGQYKKHLKGEQLTYDERSLIVRYDQKVSDWEKFDMRIDAAYEAEFEKSGLDLSQHKQSLEKLQVDQETEQISDFTNKEYYSMSRNEKAPVQRPQPKGLER